MASRAAVAEATGQAPAYHYHCHFLGAVLFVWAFSCEVDTLAAVIAKIIRHAVLAYLGGEFSIDEREIHRSWSSSCSCSIPASSCAVKSWGVGSSWTTLFFLTGSPCVIQFDAYFYEVIEVRREVSGHEEIFDLFAETVSESHDLRFLIEV